MDFYFLDRASRILGVIGTDDEQDIFLADDTDLETIANPSRTFEATVYFTKDKQKEATNLISLGNYIIYRDE